MGRGKFAVTGGTAYRDTVDAVLDCLLDRCRIKFCSVIVMTGGAVGMMQNANVHICIDGMALAARGIYHPVVMGLIRYMDCHTVPMAGVTRQVAPGSVHFLPDNIITRYFINFIRMLIMAGGAPDY